MKKRKIGRYSMKMNKNLKKKQRIEELEEKKKQENDREENE